jgi:hypothetical protein
MTRHLPIRLTTALVVLAVPLLAAAQSGGRQPAARRPPPAANVSATKAPETAGQAVYSFHPVRRDPFVSLWTPGTGPRVRTKAEGLAGLYSSELTLKGILQSDGKFVAIVLGLDAKRQYIVHPNDRLADGVVKTITADSLLILQEVNDPLSLTKQREIRKTLRAVEEVK